MNKGRDRIERTIRVRAPRSRVWRALTDPACLSAVTPPVAPAVREPVVSRAAQAALSLIAAALLVGTVLYGVCRVYA